MTGSNLLQGIGLLVCVGAIILVALVAFAARALGSSRSNATHTPNAWNRGEQPRSNSTDVDTQGIFGVPNTGTFEQGAVRRGDMIGSSGFSGGAQTFDPENPHSDPSRTNDSDQVSSSGGFGEQP